MHKIYDITFEHNELGSIYIDLSITNDYKELNVIGGFLLDTGATSTIINNNVIKILRLDNNIIKKNKGTITLADGSKRDTSTIVLKTLRIGIINFSNFPVRVLLSNDVENNKNLNILGTDILKYFDYTINMSNNNINLKLRNDYKSILQYDKTQRKNKEYYKDMIVHYIFGEDEF